MMKVHVLVGQFEGDGFSSVHLTRKGALVNAIEDIWDYMSADSTQDWVDAAGKPCYFGTREELFTLNSEDLTAIFRAWQDPLWEYANGEYTVEVIAQQVKP